jgi:hypothetical protein
MRSAAETNSCANKLPELFEGQVHSVGMNDRRRAAAAAHAQRKLDAPVAWKEYREAPFSAPGKHGPPPRQRLGWLVQRTEHQEK